MERTVTIFHEGAMAYYNVAKNAQGKFRARLITYNGNEGNTPPRELNLQKDGNRWSHEDNVDRDLVEELGYVIEMQKADFDRPPNNFLAYCKCVLFSKKL
jgi:hypothetical protein